MNSQIPHWLALLTVLIVGGIEASIMHWGAPPGLDGVVVGKVLGTMDGALMLVLSFYFGGMHRQPDPKPKAEPPEIQP